MSGITFLAERWLCGLSMPSLLVYYIDTKTTDEGTDVMKDVSVDAARMRRRIALDGLRRFISDVDARCPRGTDITSILTGQGFIPDQVAALRRDYLDPLVDAYRALIEERLLMRHDGERLYQIVERRYGLDGVAPDTLAACGPALGLSGERIRQLETTAVAYCRRRRMAWTEALGEIATRFVGVPASRVDEIAEDVRPDPSSLPGTGKETSDTLPANEDPRSLMPLPLYTREEIGAMVAAIEGKVGKGLSRTTVARVLVGHPAPEVEALVAHHALPYYGALKGLPRREVGRLIEVLRLGSTDVDEGLPS